MPVINRVCRIVEWANWKFWVSKCQLELEIIPIPNIGFVVQWVSTYSHSGILPLIEERLENIIELKEDIASWFVREKIRIESENKRVIGIWYKRLFL